MIGFMECFNLWETDHLKEFTILNELWNRNCLGGKFNVMDLSTGWAEDAGNALRAMSELTGALALDDVLWLEEKCKMTAAYFPEDRIIQMD